MQVDLNRVIEQVSKEKGIDKSIVINAVEEMMHSAARRTFGAERNIESRFNTELGEIEIASRRTVQDRFHVQAKGPSLPPNDIRLLGGPDFRKTPPSRQFDFAASPRSRSTIASSSIKLRCPTTLARTFRERSRKRAVG